MTKITYKRFGGGEVVLDLDSIESISMEQQDRGNPLTLISMKSGNEWRVDGDMAAVAVLIGYRVTDLAGKDAQVLLVLVIILHICPDILVAVFALNCIRVPVPVIYRCP